MRIKQKQLNERHEELYQRNTVNKQVTGDTDNERCVIINAKFKNCYYLLFTYLTM